MDIWRSVSEARSYGCTHRARMYGVLPGFFNENTRMWVSRSDLLNPIEDLMNFMFDLVCHIMQPEDPADIFHIKEEIN